MVPKPTSRTIRSFQNARASYLEISKIFHPSSKANASVYSRRPRVDAHSKLVSNFANRRLLHHAQSQKQRADQQDDVTSNQKDICDHMKASCMYPCFNLYTRKCSPYFGYRVLRS